MSDYDDGWNEGFDLGARKVKKLQAVVDAAKAVGKERGIHRYYKPMDVAIDAMLDAIKEVESDA
jgi:hypothetical protein